MKKIIFEKEYQGFESAYDIDRDVSECMDSRFNKAAEVLNGEFQGTLKVTIEYVSEQDTCCGGGCHE